MIRNGWNRDAEEEQVNKRLKRVEKEMKFSIRIALGDYFLGLARSYETARATLDSAHANSLKILFYQDNILPVLLLGLNAETWQYEQVQKPRERLRDCDPKGVLLETALTFFECDEDHTRTCHRLQVHRNTQRYRFKKIE